MYNGHDKIHCFKIQALTSPDGLYMALSHAYPGMSHDSHILADSRLNERMSHLQLGNQNQFTYYGDKGYPIQTSHGRGAFRNNEWMVPEQRDENRAMKVLRGVAAEIGFNKPATMMVHSDFYKTMKIRKSKVTKIYIVGCLISNAHSCLYGNNISEWFELATPSLDE
jgi:nuclease HARBI1